MTKIKTCLCILLIWRKVKEAEDSQMGKMGRAGGGVGLWVSYIILSVHVQCECLEKRSGSCWWLSGRQAEDSRNFSFPYSWSWRVQKLCHPRSNWKLTFSFLDNPYFWNTLIVKEYYHDTTGMMWLLVTVAGWWREWMLLLCDPSLSPFLAPD